MNVIAAMEETMMMADHKHFSAELEASLILDESMSYKHLCDMRATMRSEVNNMSSEKKNRWLGWIQAAVTSWGVTSLKEMKNINMKWRDDE